MNGNDNVLYNFAKEITFTVYSRRELLYLTKYLCLKVAVNEIILNFNAKFS